MSNYYLFNNKPATLSFPVGSIYPYLGSTAPSGYILCDGSAKSRFTYADLFALIGTTYGAGDGQYTFNVPDFRGYSLRGASSATSTFGTQVAAPSYTATITQWGTHDHTISPTTYNHDHIMPIGYNASNNTQVQSMYSNWSTWRRLAKDVGGGIPATKSQSSIFNQNSSANNWGYNESYNAYFHGEITPDSDGASTYTESNSFYKANMDGSSGGNATTTSAGSSTSFNVEPLKKRTNYIMNYGVLSNISNVVNIYSSDNSNYTEYTSGDVTYAMFDMTSTESYFYMEYDSSVASDLKAYLEGNFGAQLLIVGGGGAGGEGGGSLGGGGGAGGLGYVSSFNLPGEKTIYARIGKAGVDGTTYSETHETVYTNQEGKGGDTILYIDGSIAAYVDGGGSGQDDYNDTSTRWGGSAGGYSGTYTAQGSSNLSLSGSESSMGTNYGSSTYGIFTFLGNTNGASSLGYWTSYPSFWWRGGTGGGGAGGAGISHAGPYGATIRGANGTNGGAGYTWIDNVEYAGGGGGGGNGTGGGGGAGDGGAVASTIASSTAFLASGADGQSATIANRGSGGGGGFTGGSGSDGVVKIAIPKDYILSVTQIPVASFEIFTTHQGDPSISFGGSYLTSYNGIPYTFFYFTDAQATTAYGTGGGTQANQSNKFFIGTDPTLTPEQTKAISKIHGVEMLLIGAGGNGGYPSSRRGDSNMQGSGSPGGGAGGMSELHNGNLPTNQYIKFLLGQEGDTTGRHAQHSTFQNRGYYDSPNSTASNRRDTRTRTSVMQIGTTESGVSTKVLSYMGGDGAGGLSYENSTGNFTGQVSYPITVRGTHSGYQFGASAGGSTAAAGAVSGGTGGVDYTSGTYGTWNFYANSGGSSSSGYGFGIAGGGGGAGGAGYGSGNGLGGNGRAWIDGNTYCTGGGGNGGCATQYGGNSTKSGGSSNIHGNYSGNLRWDVYQTTPSSDGQGTAGTAAANSGSGGGGRVSYNLGLYNPGQNGEGGSGLAVIAIPTSLIKSIDTYDTYNTVGAILDIKYTGYGVTESTTTYNSVDYTIFELTTDQLRYNPPTYNFDFRQASTTSITDSIGGLTATYNGGMSSTVSDGAILDGNDDYIQLQSFEFGGTFSIEIYFQYTAIPSSYSRLFHTENSGTHDNTTFSLTEYSGNGYLTVQSLGNTYGANTYPASATISTNVWIHIVITMNNNTIKVYQDGSLIKTNTNANSQTVGIRDTFYLFTGTYITSKMQGNIKFFRYWHGTELSSQQVTTLYNNREGASVNTTDPPQYLSIGLKSGIKALEKYALLGGGFDIPFLAVGGGSSGAALSGSTAVGDGGSGGAVVYGTFTWDASFTTTNIFEFVCGVGAAGGATTSTRNAGGVTTIDLSGHYGLERYIDASGGEIDGSVGLGTSTTLTTYGNTNINTSGSITFNSDYAAGTASGSQVVGAGGAGAGGAGGGGAGAVGGTGGIGVAWIDGINYGPGGGGAGSTAGGSGGNLIGGTGADANATGVSEDSAATSGTANRGGGGGGGVTTGAAGTGGVVKFAIPTSYINSIGIHENTLQTSNYLKVQTSSGSPTEVNYNGVDYYLFDFQTDDNLTSKNHYFKITWADDASPATRTANAGNYGSASNLMLMVGGGGAGGDGGMPHDANDDPENWRLLVGGGGGAGGMGEVYDADIQIDELVSITVGGGGEGGLNSSSKLVCNKGSDSIIYYTSTEVARAKGGGLGNFPHDGNYNGGSGGGKTGGFTRQNIENVYGSTRAAYNGSHGYNNTKTTDSIGTSISTYGNWTFYGNEGFENEGNDSNNWIAYRGGSGGGSAHAVGTSSANGGYGGSARQWAVDGSYYAAGGGGVVLPGHSESENVWRRGNGGGQPSDNKSTRAISDIYGGSAKVAIYYSYNKYGQNTELAWYFTGYPTNTSDYSNLFDNFLQWDGTSGTGSGGGGGVDWDTEALAQTEITNGNSDVGSNAPGYTIYYGTTSSRAIKNGYAGSGGSGRVKIAIPKQINQITLIPVANIETGYTGT